MKKETRAYNKRTDGRVNLSGVSLTVETNAEIMYEAKIAGKSKADYVEEIINKRKKPTKK